ncbi:MAG: hypothetical protein ACJA2P_000155 [Rhodoferax sp.]|jgi:hypothetical protein
MAMMHLTSFILGSRFNFDIQVAFRQTVGLINRNVNGASNAAR